jgi:signal transduction histidine kinase/CheY-like chemotaxis protein
MGISTALKRQIFHLRFWQWYNGFFGGGMIEEAEDVSERKMLERQFHASQKMESIGLLAGGIAHDFNNLLTVIINYASMLLGEAQDETTKNRLQVMSNCAERAATLTGQLLSFSRQQATSAQTVNLNAVLTSLDHMVHRVIGENIALALSLEPALGALSADPSQIIRVVMNLVVNARDAMPDGGKLAIETKNVAMSETDVANLPELAAGNYVVLEVTDTGAGMDEETKSHIFERFYAPKQSGLSDGLSIPAAQRIVKQTRGQILVVSTVGKGTSFKVYFPRVDEVKVVEKGQRTVLVVEDEDVVRQVACDIIRRGGYKVIEASSAQAALEVCGQSKDEIDVVLTDLVMPKMNGPELVKRLAEDHPKVSVIFMSGYTSDAAIAQGLDAKMAFVQKPFSPKVLLQTIQDVMNTRQ